MLKQFGQQLAFKMDVFKLTLVRHGETPENRSRIIQGHRDTILSQNGAKQAELLGLWLENETFTHVYSSDLMRAQQTCEIIMKHNKMSRVHMKTDARLRERKLGVLEGQPISSSKGHLRSDAKKQTSLGMETKQQLRQHAKSFFKELCACLLQSQQRTSSSSLHRLAGADVASSLDESKGACSLSFTPAIHSLPSTVSNADIFSETLNLGAGCNIELTETPVVQLRNSFGNNNSAASDSAEQLPASEACNSNDLRLLSDCARKSTDRQGICDVRDAVGEPDDCRGISDTSDGVNRARNHLGTCSVGGDESDNSNNVCQVSGSELAAAAECPNISVTDNDRMPGNDSAVSGHEPKTECIAFQSNSQMYDFFASVLVVSHGGLLMELLAYFVKELKCKLSESQRARFRIIPNAGVSRFVVQVGDGTKAFPKVICLSVFETDHLMSGFDDVAPLVSSADLI